MKLGCCYYPEHWPEDMWAEDARRMADMGLSLVRIGEFAWSRMEPEPGRYDWDWLDRAITTLGNAGLKVILGTPTATPPKWLVDQMPDMVAVDGDGNPRKFGSRRHYCFSHHGYREECRRIVNAMAERYGKNPAISAWQTDNEYGCHETTLSYSGAAAEAFRVWLAQKYDNIEALNKAWGNVFWSMEYRDFAEIEPPNLTVTEPNPSHVLDYRRFASDEVRSFNQIQVDILREYSPDRDIIHNFMGFVTDFDHHDLGSDIDIASWDSYPLGFLEQYWFGVNDKNAYARQGHPDIAAFHHDLYRGCCKDGRWSVMEQQPGPVNWARWNPIPLPGMVKLWTLEAAAHGAEFCSYFRWRQAPFAQEQMHAGLYRPDNVIAPGGEEAMQAAKDLAALNLPEKADQAPVALVFSYEADWLFQTQPQGQNFRYIELAFEMYSALRKLGLNVDIVSPDADLTGYKIAIIPSLPILTSEQVGRIAALNVPVLFGPRSGSKTANLQIPAELPPGPLQEVLPIKVSRVASLRPGLPDGQSRWMEEMEASSVPMVMLENHQDAVFKQKNIHYLSTWPPKELLDIIFRTMGEEAGLIMQSLPPGLRIRQHKGYIFAFNYGLAACDLQQVFPTLTEDQIVTGSTRLLAAGTAVWKPNLISHP
ncbi:MAG: beta-galactosidase [Parasphingorhabdus sp.]